MTSQRTPVLELAISGLPETDDTEAIWQRHLSAWLVALQARLSPSLRAPFYSLGLTFCDDGAIAALNEQWRGQPGPTDVLAFAAQEAPIPLPPPPGPEDLEDGLEDEAPLELGDIVISRDTAWRQAQSHGHSLSHELLFLASHGLLHLLGWDHPDDPALVAMLALQDALLAATADLPDVATDPCDRKAPG